MHVLRRCKFLLFSDETYVKACTGGPDVAIMTGYHCVLNNFGGEELVIDIALPRHVEAAEV